MAGQVAGQQAGQLVGQVAGQVARQQSGLVAEQIHQEHILQQAKLEHVIEHKT